MLDVIVHARMPDSQSIQYFSCTVRSVHHFVDCTLSPFAQLHIRVNDRRKRLVIA